MKNVPVIIRESIFCSKEGIEIPIDACMGCTHNLRKVHIGFNTFVVCNYKEAGT